MEIFSISSYSIYINNSGEPDDLSQIEQLRISPSPSEKRHQSPSPPSSQEQMCHTPHKQTPPESPRKESTPRKDTPKKRKATRLQCRNKGCRDFLLSEKSRIRHENTYCKLKVKEDKELAMEDEYAVPSHSTLDLDTSQCCVCLKKYATEKSRKKHEQTHRIYEIHGRTVSQLRFPQSPETASPSKRPQSCPPPRFITPERPSKRRRTQSSSSNPEVVGILVSSPSLTSPSLSLSPRQEDWTAGSAEDTFSEIYL